MARDSQSVRPRLTLEQAAAQLADALEGAMTASGFDGDPDWQEENDATWWFCRKALNDYAEARGDGWEPDCGDDRDEPRAGVAYERKLSILKASVHPLGLEGSFGWVVASARPGTAGNRS